MLRRISYRTFVEWQAFVSLQPIGFRRTDWHFAMLMSLLANINRDTKKRFQPYEAKDFLPRFGPPEAPTRNKSAVENWDDWITAMGDAAMHQAISRRRGRKRKDGLTDADVVRKIAAQIEYAKSQRKPKKKP